MHYTFMHESGKLVQKVATASKSNPELHLLLKQAGNKLFHAEYRVNSAPWTEVVVALMKDKSCILKGVF